MGKIVGGFLVPHAPLMFQAPDAPDEGVRKRMWGAYEACAERMAVLDASSAIIIGADHYFNFGPGCLPQYLIGTGDVDGPLDALPGLQRKVIQTNEKLAAFIAENGCLSGFDWAVARALTVDHAVAIPDRLIIEPLRSKGQRIGTIPVYIASAVDPYLPMRRAVQLGAAIKAAIESAPDHERVVVIASGGISHWIGVLKMGVVNEEFDREIMNYACTGDTAGLSGLSDKYILENGGNGGMEIRQWAVAMGAMPGAEGEVIDYAPVPEWVTGMGFVQLFARG